MIHVSNLQKHFHVRVPSKSAFKSFFSQNFRLIKAVDDVSFNIARGEIVGYLGPNGAGKSTTIKMLTGLLVPSGGQLEVHGLVPWQSRRRYVARIGAVFGQRSTLWWDLPVIESLELLQFIYNLPTARFKQNLRTFEQLLGLNEFIASPARSLSLGQRMRADLCAALLHDPELLFLDEPTIGLDVVAKERIREFILHINRERGTTVLLTTHDLKDVQKLCPRVMMIDHGKLLFDGAFATLVNRFGGQRRLVVDFAEPVTNLEIPGARVVQQDGLRVTIEFPKAVSAAALIQSLSSQYAIEDLSVLEPDVEATIRAIYEENLLQKSA